MIRIIIPSYNNEKWLKANVESALNQDHKDFQILYCNDAASDSSLSLLSQITDPRLKVITATRRKGNVNGIYNAVHQHTQPDDICIILDGDDTLAHPQVLSRVQAEYNNPNVWLTYGSYRTSSGDIGCSQPIPARVIHSNSHRRAPWRSSHLRTFRSWLFKNIKAEDLQIGNRWINTAGDLAIMFPMLEMAGDHSSYIPDILYIYNDNTGHNDHILRRQQQIQMEMRLRSAQRYQPLTPKAIDCYYFSM